VTPILPGGDSQTTPPWNTFVGTSHTTIPTVDRWRPVRRLAWLPAEFRVSSDGKSCAINSYISGLHPSGDADVCVLCSCLLPRPSSGTVAAASLTRALTMASFHQQVRCPLRVLCPRSASVGGSAHRAGSVPARIY
jgi:hypothetical protein